MNVKDRKTSRLGGTGNKDGNKLFGKNNSIIATYSKNRPLQVVNRYDFLTPDTPQDWEPLSKEKTGQQGCRSWTRSQGSRGSSLALRNISNIPLGRTLSRTPCVHGDQRTNVLGLPLVGVSSTKKPSKAKKLKCNQHPMGLKRTNPSNMQSFKKLKEMTTYAVKSMSTCSMTSIHGDNAPLLSTVKSMSLCSTPHGGISEQLQDDSDVIEAEVLQPQNSTFIEEDFHVELQDIFPQDLSAIIEEPVDKQQEKYSPEKRTDFKHAKTGCPELDANDEQDVTPEVNSKKECTLDDEPRQKRKLAYSMDTDKEKTCVLLDVLKGDKKQVKICFQHHKAVWSCNDLKSLPTDVLIIPS